MYIVKDGSGRIWKTFRTNKDANLYIESVRDFLTSILSVEYVAQPK